MSTSLSVVRDFFDSQSFDEWKKAREQMPKLLVAVIDRIDSLQKSLNAMAQRRR